MRIRHPGSLRTQLREATREEHDALDAEMRATGWQDRTSYGRFLQLQHAARHPLESWAKTDCPEEIAPPGQIHLIERDLKALGCTPLDTSENFSLPGDAEPIGFAWAIAGSSLGNRAILREVERDSGTEMPCAFLRDEGMTAFWQSLRVALERPVSDHHASGAALAARAVFDHFRKTVASLAPGKDTE